MALLTDVIFWALNELRKKWLFQHRTANLSIWWGICTFSSTQATSGRLERSASWWWRWFMAAPLYPATFSDLPFVVSSALIKSLHSMSNVEPFPLHSALTFFVHSLFPKDWMTIFQSSKISRCFCVPRTLFFFCPVFNLAWDEPSRSFCTPKNLGPQG